MAKVVYNNCFGGFSISDKAIEYLREHGISEEYCTTYTDIPRHDPTFIKCIEELGSFANGRCAKLNIYETVGNIYRIDEYDGLESVIEPKDETWITI